MADPLLRFAPFQHSTHVYSVGELSLHVASVLEADPVLQDVWLRGEVVNVSRSPAGHYYFSLKDDDAQLRCVLFRGSAFNSPVMPANGLALVAHGAVHLYARQGTLRAGRRSALSGRRRAGPDARRATVSPA